MGAADTPLACISFDVEPFDIPTEYGIDLPVDRQYEIGCTGLVYVLEMLDSLQGRTKVSPGDIRATFFITGEFALRFPTLVRQIAQSPLGHEVASHGYTHGDLEPGHLELSRRTLGEIIGARVTGFRRARMAPTDAGEIVAAGYTYNASENPIWLPGRYNHFFSPRRPRVESTPHGPLVQIPASATPLLRIPLFWLAFKNLPMPVIRAASRWTLAADRSLNTYFHPWEFMELAEWGGKLPGVVRCIDGRPLLGRLAGYLRWLAARAEFATYNTLAERVRSAGNRP